MHRERCEHLTKSHVSCPGLCRESVRSTFNTISPMGFQPPLAQICQYQKSYTWRRFSRFAQNSDWLVCNVQSAIDDHMWASKVPGASSSLRLIKHNANWSSHEKGFAGRSISAPVNTRGIPERKWLVHMQGATAHPSASASSM